MHRSTRWTRLAAVWSVIALALIACAEGPAPTAPAAPRAPELAGLTTPAKDGEDWFTMGPVPGWSLAWGDVEIERERMDDGATYAVYARPDALGRYNGLPEALIGTRNNWQGEVVIGVGIPEYERVGNGWQMVRMTMTFYDQAAGQLVTMPAFDGPGPYFADPVIPEPPDDSCPPGSFWDPVLRMCVDDPGGFTAPLSAENPCEFEERSLSLAILGVFVTGYVAGFVPVVTWQAKLGAYATHALAWGGLILADDILSACYRRHRYTPLWARPRPTRPRIY